MLRFDKLNSCNGITSRRKLYLIAWRVSVCMKDPEEKTIRFTSFNFIGIVVDLICDTAEHLFN